MTLFLSAQDLLALLRQNPVLALFGVPLLLILADVLTGIASAMKVGIFTTKEVSRFLSGDLARYLVVMVLSLLIFLVSGSVVASSACTLLGLVPLSASLLGSILANLRELGVPTPIVSEVQQMGSEVLAGWQNPSSSVAPSSPRFASVPVSNQDTSPLVTMLPIPPSTLPSATTAVQTAPMIVTIPTVNTSVPTPLASSLPQQQEVVRTNTPSPVPISGGESSGSELPPISLPTGF